MSMRRHRAPDYTTARRPAGSAVAVWPPTGLLDLRRPDSRLVGTHPRPRSPSPVNPNLGWWDEQEPDPIFWVTATVEMREALTELNIGMMGELKDDVEFAPYRHRFSRVMPSSWSAIGSDRVSGYTHDVTLLGRSPDGETSHFMFHTQSDQYVQRGFPLSPLNVLHPELRALWIREHNAAGEMFYEYPPSINIINFPDELMPDGRPPHGFTVDFADPYMDRDGMLQTEYYRTKIPAKVRKERDLVDVALSRAGVWPLPRKLWSLRRRTDYLQSVVCDAFDGASTARNIEAGHKLRLEYARMRKALLEVVQKPELIAHIQSRIDAMDLKRTIRMAHQNSAEVAFLIAHDREVDFSIFSMYDECARRNNLRRIRDPTKIGPWPLLSTRGDRHSSQVFVGFIHLIARLGITYAAIAAISAVADGLVGMATETPTARMCAAMEAMPLRQYFITRALQANAAERIFGYPGRRQIIPIYTIFDDVIGRGRYGVAVVCVIAAVLYNTLMFQRPLMDGGGLRSVAGFVGGTEGHMGPEDAAGADFVLGILQLFLGPRFTQLCTTFEWVVPSVPGGWAEAAVDTRAPPGALGASPGVGRPMAPDVRVGGNYHHPEKATYQKNQGEAAHRDGNHHHPEKAAHPKNHLQHYGKAAHRDGNHHHQRKAAHPKKHQEHRWAQQMALPAAPAGCLSPEALRSFFDKTPSGTGYRCATAMISAAGLDDPRRKDGQAMNVVSIAEAVAAEMTPAVLVKAVDRMMAAHRHPGA